MKKEEKNIEEETTKALSKTNVSKSFSVGKVIEITKCIYGHQFNVGELVRIIKRDSLSEKIWLCTNTRSEYWVSEREANVC